MDNVQGRIGEDRGSVVRKVTEFVTSFYSGDWQRAFAAFAPNGQLAHSGLVDVLAAAGVGYMVTRPAIATEVLNALDTNSDGVLTFEEFNAVAKVVAPPVPPK